MRPMQGLINLSEDLKKDLAGFRAFLPQTNLIIHEETRVSVPLHMGAYMYVWLWGYQ